MPTSLTTTLPETLWPGRGTACLVHGYACGKKRLDDVVLREPVPSVSAHTMRHLAYEHIDQYCHSDNAAACLQSGFTSLVRFDKDIVPGVHVIPLEARFTDRQRQAVAAQDIDIRRSSGTVVCASPFRQQDAGRRTVICMATWEPDEARLRRQIDSIRAQTLTTWHCIINDDASSDEAFSRYAEIIGDDDRFSVYRNEVNLGFYGNFEMALSRVPPDVDYVALADQDDYWYPQKLAVSIEHFSAANTLVYCDMRVVDESGETISSTYWSGRRNNYRDAHILFLANTVTGAASVFRRSLLDDVLPFPQPVGQVFHDHWIACVARCHGEIGYVDRALYDYYQYGSSVIGHCDFARKSAWQRVAGVADKLCHVPTPGRIKAWMLRKRNAALNVFYLEYLRLYLFSEILRLRIPDIDAEAGKWLGMFSGGWAAVYHLLRAHLRIMRAGDTTDDAELRLASAVAVFQLDRLYGSLFARRILKKHCKKNR